MFNMPANISYEEFRKQFGFNSFIFLGERVKQNYAADKAFINNYYLKLANPNQIMAIKSFVNTDALLKLNWAPIHIYENEIILDRKEDGSVTIDQVPLAPQDFRYWIIEYPEYEVDENMLPSISLLSKDLTMIAQIHGYGSGYFDIQRAVAFYASQQLGSSEPTEINEQDLQEFEVIYNSVVEFKKSSFESSSIGKSLKDFIETQEIGLKSPFKIIALFSVIESLLTTNNKNSDQSINRQLQKKIKLLNNQFNIRIDFFSYFKGPNTLTEEKIIEALYTYRSKIAHGDYYDFDNELQILGKHERTYEFLNLLTKRLLLFAINNCQLMLDLKEC